LDVISKAGTGSPNSFLFRSYSLISPNGQPIPAVSARRKYSPTVLLEMLQAPALARFDKPASYFKCNISLIFRTLAPHCLWCSAGVVNRSGAMFFFLFLEDKHAIFGINHYFSLRYL
jgi:hypothetical protein